MRDEASEQLPCQFIAIYVKLFQFVWLYFS